MHIWKFKTVKYYITKYYQIAAEINSYPHKGLFIETVQRYQFFI